MFAPVHSLGAEVTAVALKGIHNKGFDMSCFDVAELEELTVQMAQVKLIRYSL